MFSTNPTTTAAYRAETKAGKTQCHISRRRCAHCGRERDMWLMRRIGKGPSTRMTPTRWECKDGCK